MLTSSEDISSANEKEFLSLIVDEIIIFSPKSPFKTSAPFLPIHIILNSEFASINCLVLVLTALTIEELNPPHNPLSVEEQVVVIFSGVRGFLDKIEISDIAKFEEALLNNLRSSKTLLAAIKEKAALDEDMEKSITAVIEEVIKDFI